MLEIKVLPEQCGVGVITGFYPEWDNEIDGYEETGVEAKELLELCTSARTDFNHGMVLATFNSEQLRMDKKLPATFRKAGLQCLTTFMNPNSGNQVWIYYKLLVEPERKPRTTTRRVERPRRAGVRP